MSIQVRGGDGSTPSLRSSVVRNVARLVDWLPFLYAVGIVVLALSDRNERLGDRLGNTAVVRV
ncbi:MAG: RDD family protein [Halobacteriales archaeon]